MLKSILKYSVVYLMCVQLSLAENTCTLKVDLSQGSKTVPFPCDLTNGGDINLTIVNKLPNILYTSNVEIRYNPIFAPLPNLNKDNKILQSEEASQAVSNCNEAKHKKFLKEFKSAKNESEIPHILEKLKRLHEKEGCKIINSYTYEDIEKYTIEKMRKFHISKNTNLLFTYKRKEKNATKEWKFKWKARQTGHWLTHFGFSFMKKSKDRYYLKENKKEDGSNYIITKQRESEGLDYVPSLMYTYYEDDWAEIQSFQLAATAGVSFDNDKISIFLGPSIVLADNLLLSIGVSVGKVKELKGKYPKENFEIKTNDENLLYEDVYKARCHITFGYRFGGDIPKEHTKTVSFLNSE